MKLTIRITLLIIMLFGNKLNASTLDIGQKLPSIKATLDSGEKVDLASKAAKGYTLVYFYPKADTPGCTKQACSLRDAYEVLLEKGVTIFGVSKDSVKSQHAFKEKYALPFSLVADSDSEVIDRKSVG